MPALFTGPLEMSKEEIPVVVPSLFPKEEVKSVNQTDNLKIFEETKSRFEKLVSNVSVAI